MLAIDPPFVTRPAVHGNSAASDAAASIPRAVPLETRQWSVLAVASLVIAGLLSLSVVVGRLPVISRWIGDPLFFKRCLVVHVDMALVVWFYTFIAALCAMRAPAGSGWLGRGTVLLAGVGMLGMLAGGLVPGAAPVLSNYVPVIDHPVFLGGLTVFFGALLLYFLRSVLVRTTERAGGLPADAAIGLQGAGIAVALAGATWVAAKSGLPEGLDAWTRFEFSGWGAGHVLQAANAAAMLSVWLWLLHRATGSPVLSGRAAQLLFSLLLAPHFIMPLLTWRGSLHPLYVEGATMLMRWGIFPVVVVVMALSVRHLRRCGGNLADEPCVRMARAGFAASALLTLLGILLGAAIRGSTTLIPAHYHASLGGVTASFMAGFYLILEAAAHKSPGGPLPTKLWRSARRQIILFGFGQSVFAIGFGIGGLYGLGRKSYAAEQHVRSAGELAGLGVMGLGGLLAAAAGLWFLFLVIREMRRWGRRSENLITHSIPTEAIP